MNSSNTNSINSSSYNLENTKTKTVSLDYFHANSSTSTNDSSPNTMSVETLRETIATNDNYTKNRMLIEF